MAVGGNNHGVIYGFMMRTMGNIIDRWHLIFDSNSTIYIETYIISTKLIKLYHCLTLHTPFLMYM